MTQVLGQTSHFCSHRLLGGPLPSFQALFSVAEPLHLLSVWPQKETSETLVCPPQHGQHCPSQGRGWCQGPEGRQGPRGQAASGGNISPTIFLCPLTQSFAQPGALLSRSVAGHAPKGDSPGARPCSLDTGMWIPGEGEILGATA